jgi:hypoxanthine phosphoribosyltransferase
MDLIIKHTQITKAIEGQASWLNKEVEPSEPIWLIGVLNGAFHYVSELSRLINNPVMIDFMRTSSYKGKDRGKVVIDMYPKLSCKGMTIVLCDDVYDSGETIDLIKNYLRTAHNPKRIIVMTCFDKGDHEVIIDGKLQPEDKLNHYGIKIDPKDFLVGFGMDYNEFNRNVVSVYSI